MDRASQVLAQDQVLPPGVRRSYRNLAKYGEVAHTTLHHRARGRRSRQAKDQDQQYLTPSEEKALIKFLLHMSDLGQPVRIKYIASLAFSITRQRPINKRPPKPPGKNWPRNFEIRNPILTARRVAALDWNRHPNNIYDKITDWFEKIGEVLQSHAILPKNVYNMDETGVMLSMLGSVKVLIGKEDLRKYRGARVNRTVVTAIECVSADGRYLDPMIIWPASTHRADWTTKHTPGWHYACSESGYTDSEISFEWLKRVFDPQTKERANRDPRVLICDGFATHESLEILEFCFENNIIPCRLPSHTSHKLQPCDVAVFAPLKAAYRDQVDQLERGGVGTIGKGHFTYLYYPARIRAFTEKNILAGWSKSGLFPFNPDRVLRDTPKPVANSNVNAPYEVDISSVPQGNVVETPITPVTPVNPEAVVSLQAIISQDAHTLDDASKWRLQRHVQKLANAASISFAERALQKEQIRFLYKMNNEAKVRRSTKSVVLGKAKVMSYEDLEEARAKRATKDAAKAEGKGKRGRKRKSQAAADVQKQMAPVVDVPEFGAPVAGILGVSANMAAVSEFRAPVARMI